jgi:hypothetical protein
MPDSPPTSSERTNSRGYKRHRERAKTRSAEITLAGQDIAPLPAGGDIARRNQANEDLRFFCETYFSHLFTKPWSNDHLRIIAKIERVVRNHETIAVAMPRGSGKTTLCLAAAMWAILSGRHSFVCLIAGSMEAAKDLLTIIKTQLSALIPGDDRFMLDYKEALYPIRKLEGESRRCAGQRYYGVQTNIGWNNDEIIMPTMPGSLCSGSIIRVSGITGSIRGALHARKDGTQVRPTLVLCDDPQTDQSAKSSLQTAERLSIINGAIKGLAGPGERTAIIVPCTVIQSGDMADQLLNRAKNPMWQGERTKMLNSLPVNTAKWDEYWKLRMDEFASGGDGSISTQFYADNQDVMDAGAEAAWPERYRKGEISAIQCAMNIKYEDEASFFAEYQNDPKLGAGYRDDMLAVQGVMDKSNGRPKNEVPIACTKLTMFVDVHDKVLFYCVCGWQDDFTGYVVDYGTFPPQPTAYFSVDDVQVTLQSMFPKARNIEGAMQEGLDKLVSMALSTDYKRGTGLMRIDRLLVDMGYKPGIVGDVKHKSGGAAMMLCKGVGIKAGRKPMSAWEKKVGETHGTHWMIPNVSRTREFPHILSDVNYWKSFVHARLAATAGDMGSLTLFGQPKDHELFAQHIAGSETWVETEGWGRKLREWTLKPNKPDNHWLDCLVGCAVGASLCGVRMIGEPADPPRQRKRYTQDDINRAQRRR